MSQEKEDGRFVWKDWLIIILVLVCFFSALFLFLFETVTEEGSQREVVGNVIYRNRVAQKRYSNSIIWQDVQQKELVQNYDSIRTDESAEAIILLNSGTRIELDPLSMIVLNIEDENADIVLERGSLYIEPAAGDRVSVKKKNRSIFNFDSVLRIFGDETERIVLYSEGKVSLRNLDGDNKDVPAEGEVLTLQPKAITEIGKEVLDLGESLITIAPEDNSRYFVGKKETIDILFRWENTNRDSILFQLAIDPFFTNIYRSLESKNEELELSLPEGNYYWRIKSGSGISIPKRIRIKERSRLAIFSPSHREILSIYENDLTVFQWNELESLDSYRLEIADNQNFDPIIKESLSNRNSLSLRLETGKYFVRVVGLGNVKGSETTSQVLEFELVHPNELEKVEEKKEEDTTDTSLFKQPIQQKKPAQATKSSIIPIYPKGTIDMAKKASLSFRWKGIPDVDEYEFILKEEKTGGKTLVSRNVKGLQFTLKDLTILDIGQFSWQVKATHGSTGESIVSPATKIQIILSEDLDAPELDF